MSYFENRKSVNLDITFRCPLECSKCPRQYFYYKKNKVVEGLDMSYDAFVKILNHFESLNFCGQVSDPVNHPNFINFLNLCNVFKKFTTVHTANSHKTIDWYKEAFETNKNAEWHFGISGLPKDSHLYRKNQDGEKLFKIMLLAKKILRNKPIWQYIIFSYNENDIETAKQIAKKEGIILKLLLSTRFDYKDDPLKPKNKQFYVEN
jgi:MoaA/NifB/PqqE/SkfB family radical SAM enzyme